MHRPARAAVRRFAAIFAGLLVMVLVVALGRDCQAETQAQNYPSRPVKFIVPTPPGGVVDVCGRILANYLQGALGQPFVVDNRAGAGNTIGSKDAAEATPDGYTLLFSAASGMIIAPLLHPNAGYDPLTSFDPIALLAASPLILVVNPAVPAHSVAELVAYAKANPGKVNFSSGGIGVLPHLTGEFFKAQAGIDIVHVPYKGGGPSVTDLVAGNVQLTFENSGVLIPLIESGKLRALAVTSPQRMPELPDVPTMVESGYPTFVITAWTGLVAPAHTPVSVIAKLNAAINAGLATPALREPLVKLGFAALGGTPADLTAVMRTELDRWRPIVTRIGLDRAAQ
jgi:tripartite-type tricarboxylate transporter receptor subunit TctC